MKKYYYALMYVSITHHLLGSHTATAPDQDTLRYTYWQPITAQAIETQLQEVIDIDKQIAKSNKSAKSIINRFTGKASAYKKQGDELAAQGDEKEKMCLAQAIPPLMQQRDRNILTHPVHLTNKHHTTALIEYITSDEYEEPLDETIITSGPYYETLKKIKSYYPQLAHVDILLKHRYPEANSSYTGTGPLAFSGVDKKTSKYQISLSSIFYKATDANKLHTLLHELNHILYSDSNHSFLQNMRSTNELKNMTSIPLLQAMIDDNHEFVVENINRYIEWRCDTQAMFAMQCPYCLVEVAEETYNSKEKYSNTPGIYHDRGYLTMWQMIPRIEELYHNQNICQYHLDTTLNQTIHDGSSLLQRLEIIYNHPIPITHLTHMQFLNS